MFSQFKNQFIKLTSNGKSLATIRLIMLIIMLVMALVFPAVAAAGPSAGGV